MAELPVSYGSRSTCINLRLSSDTEQASKQEQQLPSPALALLCPTSHTTPASSSSSSSLRPDRGNTHLASPIGNHHTTYHAINSFEKVAVPL